MEILQVLWEAGPSTVRFVHERVSAGKDTPYTSTLKIMQLMHDKKMLHRDSSAMTHVYRAAVREAPIKKALLNRFVDSVFKGSPSALLLQLLGTAKPSEQELDTLKGLLEKLEQKKP